MNFPFFTQQRNLAYFLSYGSANQIIFLLENPFKGHLERIRQMKWGLPWEELANRWPWRDSSCWRGFFFSACRGSGGLSMKAVEIHGDSRSLLKISQRLRIL